MLSSISTASRSYWLAMSPCRSAFSPIQMTPAEAAAADEPLALMFWGAIPMLPVILRYTVYLYWLLRTKVTDEAP